ncbi:glycosyltransferase family 8 protein [Alloscardovia theropitheci]|uniref:Glycosyltransferase family 8 protein n=1 Tax=Alloscardovia theropitheci TaxID=2496842 RepID=A0A4R0QWH6_9BIFI|nr:glycosyltransferase family 8 protein [Alloscardovia theropitheci]TCD53870.1 glycosyltransferase family 8 protein [Alloscardovia theropitheci]
MTNSSSTVDVFYSSDEKFVPILSVALTSLVLNTTPKRNYSIHILGRGITPQSAHKLESIVSTYPNISMEILDMDQTILETLQKDDNKLYAEVEAIEMYFRLFISQLFPHIDRGIYVDADTIFESDVADLYDIDLEGNLVGAVGDPVVSDLDPDLRRYATAMVGISPEDYVNSGVLLMDLAAWNQYKVAEHFTQLLTQYHVSSIAPDQDYLNAMFEGRIKRLPFSWNVMMAAGVEPPEDIHFIHWNLVNKPWKLTSAPFSDRFWYYADQSPFAEQVHNSLNESTRTPEDDRQRTAYMIGKARDFSHNPVTFRSLKEKGVRVKL